MSAEPKLSRASRRVCREFGFACGRPQVSNCSVALGALATEGPVVLLARGGGRRVRGGPEPVPPVVLERVDLVEGLQLLPVQNPAQGVERIDGTSSRQGGADRPSAPLPCGFVPARHGWGMARRLAVRNCRWGGTTRTSCARARWPSTSPKRQVPKQKSWRRTGCSRKRRCWPTAARTSVPTGGSETAVWPVARASREEKNAATPTNPTAFRRQRLPERRGAGSEAGVQRQTPRL